MNKTLFALAVVVMVGCTKEEEDTPVPIPETIPFENGAEHEIMPLDTLLYEAVHFYIDGRFYSGVDTSGGTVLIRYGSNNWPYADARAEYFDSLRIVWNPKYSHTKFFYEEHFIHGRKVDKSEYL